jgi:hypothetical protein
MKQDATELRALIHQSHIQPVRVHMDDGKVYTITHPDYALLAGDVDALVLVSGPGVDLGDTGLAICYFDHISRVEVPKKKSKAAA